MVMIQRVDQKSDIFAQIDIHVVWSGKQFRRLVDTVCCQNFADRTLFISFIEGSQTICKEAKS